MSRIGVKKIEIPDSVTVTINKGAVKVKGPKGELTVILHRNIEVTPTDKMLEVKPKVMEKPNAKALWGTFRMLIANAIEGVSKGFEKELELTGTGFKVQTTGKKLTLELGFSHPVEIEAPEGITFAVEKNTIKVSGIDKQLVGEMAAQVRSKKKTEPYKGKGIKYIDEYVRRKSGKKVVGEEE